MLSCYRGLDLTDEKGFACGRALADLGADVIKIEKPGGDSARSIGPFYHDIPDREKSLYWFAFNANKRGITLDIETADGKEIFKKLVEGADFVIESFAPGYMDKLGLGYSVLSQINPKIVMTSISGFGQANGPYRDYKPSDIVIWALSGLMYICGDPDRPPLVPTYKHAFLYGAMQGSVGTMVALYNRHNSGRGQHVDVSAQMAAVFPSGVEVQGSWAVAHECVQRSGRAREKRGISGVYWPRMWQCKDGDVTFPLSLGAGTAPANKMLAQWIEKEGLASEIFKQIDWDKMGWGEMTVDLEKDLIRILKEFFLRHTKKDLFKLLIKEEMQMAPALNAKETLELEHLAARNFWVKVEHPELGTSITYPGAFVKLSDANCGIRRRAPLIGEHNEEIYRKELGLSAEDLISAAERKVI
jgi:crotonobetainyl-CoA:carnitine CoA-transferase CaiB-like acyl-CoA transferase